MKNYHITLKGYVGGFDFDENAVRDILDAHQDEQVDVLIDSLGGYLGTALSVAAAFREHGNVHVHFVGMNASAATIASLGAAHISIDKNAMYLAHRCSSEVIVWQSMNAEQLAKFIADKEKCKGDLEKFDANIASMYADRTGKCIEDVLQIMSDERWLSAAEVLELGLVDEITDFADEKAPKISASLISQLSSAGMPIPVGVAPDNGMRNLFNIISNFFRTMISNSKPVESQEPEQVADLQQQIVNLQTELNQRDAQIESLNNTVNELNARISELSERPAEPNNVVVNNGSPAPSVPMATEDPVERYCNSLVAARKLFNSLP